MLTLVLRTLLQEYRTRRMARFAFWVAAYGVALWILDHFGSGTAGSLWALFWISLIPIATYYLVRLVRFIRDRMLWRLRRRLIITYLFIAVVPIFLILLMVGLKDFLSSGQFAAFLVAWKLRDHSEKLQELNRVVARVALMESHSQPEALLNRVQDFCAPDLAKQVGSFPDLEVTLRLGGLSRAFRGGGKPQPEPVAIPPWLDRDEFAGIVLDRGQLALRALSRVRTSAGDLTVIHSQPITPELLDYVGAGIGPVSVLITTEVKTGTSEGAASSSSGFRLQTPETEYVQSGTIRSKSVRLPDPTTPIDITVVGTSTLEPTVWGGEAQTTVQQPVFIFVTSRISTLNREMIAPLGRFSRAYLIVFLAIALIFLVIELVALVIGVRMTRSITRTVDNLYDATERVKAGDLTYRINLPARDQLSALGEAFDSMTTSVQGLLRESEEKSRLQSELEIAKEVQNQLFPRTVPRVPGLEVYGVCKPARVVSGDYYDFLDLGENRLGLVLGDVAGKGISAALLMAAIQSSLRAQTSNGFLPGRDGAGRCISTSEIVSRLNRQLYDSTSIETYATFFCSVYDGNTRKLTYTNAGHLPPVVFRGSEMKRLEKGGTVVGLFSPVTYEEGEIELEPGDLLLAFTDGLTEPENVYDEEFGEERLLKVAQRALLSPPRVLVEEIYRSVNDWTGSPELQDDMTLLVAKAVD
ncbi:MAG TPA: SpoIIE family protein phosphatase [Terriglobia bacterium]|nr:SpoIIE family protein phosphatase [Terriglobia bacterium]